MTDVRICLVASEVAPFVGGGIALYVNTLARALSPIADVTVVTLDRYAEEHERLVRSGSPALPPGVRFQFARIPDERLSYHHAVSAGILEAIEQLYDGDGPDLIELPDYHAPGFALMQAKCSRHRTLERTRMVARAHSTWELCAIADRLPMTSRDERVLCAMERYVLRHADRFLWAGGDILRAYQRRYGRDGLAPAIRIRHPLPAADPGGAQAGHGPLSFLFVGRMQRLKGVLELVRGFMRHADDDWRLTLVGGDTDTGPGGRSMHATLELITAGDERITITGALPRSETAAAVRSHDVLVMPSYQETWPYAVQEAMQADRPVLATAVGGLPELVADGETGWLIAPGEEPLADAVGELLRNPGAARAITRSRAPSARVAALSGEDAIRDAYAELASIPLPQRRPQRRKPLVSVVIPHAGSAALVADAVASVDAQTYRELEIVVVDDGWVHAERLGTLESRHRMRVLHQPNRGPGGARNAGIVQSGGRYVLPLDPGTTAEPAFVERCVALLEDDSPPAYVTSWTRLVDPDGGAQPLGNFDAVVDHFDVAGDAAAVWPRRLFDRGFRYSEDLPLVEAWTLYRRMRRAGLHGHVIPEWLLRRRAAQHEDVDALRVLATAELRCEEFQWTA